MMRQCIFARISNPHDMLHLCTNSIVRACIYVVAHTRRTAGSTQKQQQHPVHRCAYHRTMVRKSSEFGISDEPSDPNAESRYSQTLSTITHTHTRKQAHAVFHNSIPTAVRVCTLQRFAIAQISSVAGSHRTSLLLCRIQQLPNSTVGR